MPAEPTDPRIPSHRSSSGSVIRHSSSSKSRAQPGEFRPRRAPRPGGRSSRGQRQRTVIRIRQEWVLGVGVFLILAISGAILWVVGKQNSRADEQAAITPAVVEAAVPAEQWHGPSPSEVGNLFLAATTQEERLKWVRNPDKVAPVMERFYREGPGAREVVIGTTPLSASNAGGQLFELSQVEMDGARPRLLSVVVDPRGAKVDFLSYARHCSEAWEDLFAGKVAGADEVRVVVQIGNFYLREFADESRWLHLRAGSPDLDETLDFYVDRSQPMAEEFLAKGNTTRSRVNLAIRAVGESWKHRQFEVTGLNSFDWVDPRDGS